MSGRKRKTYLHIKDEQEIIKNLSNGENVAALARRYCVSISKIYSIKRSQKEISKFSEESHKGKIKIDYILYFL